jgi:hypothetical protein
MSMPYQSFESSLGVRKGVEGLLVGRVSFWRLYCMK